MVPHAFPVAKLGLIILKLINKPLAHAIRNHAKNSSLFRSYVCMPPANLYNWCEVKTNMWILNLGKSVSVPPLKEAVAIDLGANLIGEGLMFATGVSVIISEYNKSLSKENFKEMVKQNEITELKNLINELFSKKDDLSAGIREVSRRINALESKLNEITSRSV
ncbi:unnamed protein product [Psylliodes chrysocephalus]|uniref:OPA3-like protein CG13603 n=1 Tax=Psylliodes chrysocephalus TaxID=3402493 RepID=A0A9P0CCE3_9CUCU|nr:unnamed protein product [Psylliodes chrysocephala]